MRKGVYPFLETRYTSPIALLRGGHRKPSWEGMDVGVGGRVGMVGVGWGERDLFNGGMGLRARVLYYW